MQFFQVLSHRSTCDILKFGTKVKRQEEATDNCSEHEHAGNQVEPRDPRVEVCRDSSQGAAPRASEGWAVLCGETYCNNACVSKDRFAWAWGLGPRGGKHWVVRKDGVIVNSNRGWGETAVPLSGSSVGPYFMSLNPNVTGLFL